MTKETIQSGQSSKKAEPTHGQIKLFRKKTKRKKHLLQESFMLE